MSQTDPAPTDPHQEISLAAPEEQSKQGMKGLGNLVERITPWLFTFGSWIFGGLIALNLIIMTSLITVGPIHPAILVSTIAFACALPLNVAGLFLLRLIQDMREVGIEEHVLHAFQDAGFPIEAYFPPPQEMESLYKRRTNVALRYLVGILALSTVLTLTGTVAVLWYMAWWIGVVFLAMAILSPAIVIVVIIRLLPPESEAEKELKRRYEEMTRQAKARFKKNEERI
jgi:ABC-type multidrug transport system fused ATPase/permease subunit